MFLAETRSFSLSQRGFLRHRSCLFNPLLQEGRVTRLVDEGRTVDLDNLTSQN